MAFENVVDTIRTYQTCRMVLEQLSYHELIRLRGMVADELCHRRLKKEACIQAKVEDIKKEIAEYELDINVEITWHPADLLL